LRYIDQEASFEQAIGRSEPPYSLKEDKQSDISQLSATPKNA
jgi:hypothetical protein